MVMNECIRDDGNEGGYVMMKGDNITAVFQVKQCHEEKDATRARGLIGLMGLLEDQSGWYSQENYVKGIYDSLADGLSLTW